MTPMFASPVLPGGIGICTLCPLTLEPCGPQVEAASGGARSWVPAFDEAGYRHEAKRLGITAPKVEEVVAWHKDYSRRLLA